MTNVRIIEIYENGIQKSMVARVTKAQIDVIRTFILLEGGSEARTGVKNRICFKVPAPCMKPYIKQIMQKCPGIKFVEISTGK